MKLEKRAEEKKQEIFEIAQNTIAPYFSNPEQLSRKIIEHFCRIAPPEIDTTIHLITNIKPGGLGGAKSSKPGNIWLNWRKLLIDGAESILTIVGAVAVPWLIPLAGLVVWNKVWSLASIKIDERHAAVIWTMWKNRDEENCIENDKILDLVNKELSEYLTHHIDTHFFVVVQLLILLLPLSDIFPLYWLSFIFSIHLSVYKENITKHNKNGHNRRNY